MSTSLWALCLYVYVMEVHAETDYNTLNYSGRSGQAHSPSLLATVLTPPFQASAWSIKVQQGNRSSEWVTPAAHGKGWYVTAQCHFNASLTSVSQGRLVSTANRNISWCSSLKLQWNFAFLPIGWWGDAPGTAMKGPTNKAIDLLIRDAIWLQLQTNWEITSTVNNIHYFHLLAWPKQSQIKG